MEINKEQLSKDIGKRIATRRKQLGLTQEQVAERTGLSAQFFACVERGIKNVRAESLLRICLALDISADYILTGRVIEADRSRIGNLIRPLEGTQLHCLEEIVRYYVAACDGENLPIE